MTSKQVYFISDIHLGIDTVRETSAQREDRLSNWLLSIVHLAEEIYFLGDIFDYWFEFPKSEALQYPKFYKALRELQSSGVSLYFFTGNHDMWLDSYFTTEFDIPVIKNPITKTIKGKQFYLAHGDGLGKGDYGYKLLKTIMRHPISIALYSCIPAQLGFKLMRYSSRKSRERSEETFKGFDNERLIAFCEIHQQSNAMDYYIMGHRHLPIDYDLTPETRYINLGDWLQYDSFAVFDGEHLTLELLADGNYEILTNRKP